MRLPEITAITHSGDNPSLTIYLRAGVRNGRAVITTASTNNFTLVTYDPTGTYVGDVCSNSLLATPSLTVATITSMTLTRDEDYAAYNGTVTFSLIPNTLIISSDILRIVFNKAGGSLFYYPGTSSITCKMTSGVAIPCNATYTSTTYLS